MKLHTDLKNRRFDRIVFNFPHAGFKGKEYEVYMINLHKELVREFFRNARHLLRPYGEIHVSHKTGKWYDEWGLEDLAAEFSLILVEKVGFQKEDYPGYHQKKGDGPACDKPFPLGNSFTFKFKIGDLKKRKKRNGRRAGAISSVGGDPRHKAMPSSSTCSAKVWATVCSTSLHSSGAHDSAISCRIPSSMGRISRTSLLAPQRHPRYERRIIAEPLGNNTDYFASEYRRSLVREYGMQRQQMPEGTSLNYSGFLEARQWESVQTSETGSAPQDDRIRFPVGRRPDSIVW
ncbi:unnamed protein product [Miscanthus lutarioriparius]|uniref:25S rRNA (uridine-N(3))-methyltransferase BMT5-like domain-containing protein n=1 Tax=Miscanthus lutarioriparius TaxID=422564 RepID=A0A811NIR3_9POAL|nr:unnamed protein product [Miscanthus lutarioriparius]